ncbi:MAG TPA: SufE family protein [Bacteroidia bacterium]|jgi:cysteine desulfuration protein SufE|nr:SufE family protein [Bacteroidia bacterium]
MNIAETEKEIEEEFSFFESDWEAKYEHLIDIGKSLPLIASQFRTDDRLIKGCQSQVWLYSELKNGNVYFTADSDAIITKGIVGLLVRVLSGHTPDEILDASMEFIDRIGLKQHLSPTRANGLVSMIRQMKLDALAFKTKV